MALAPFFFRAYSAIGPHLGITPDQLKTALNEHIVGIKFGQTCSLEGNEKWIAELLTNMLVRLYPVISFSGDESACISASKIALDINPDIEIKCCPNDARIIVCIGEPAKNVNEFEVNSSGWVAFINNSGISPTPGPANPYSSGAAAALAAWQVFQIVFFQTETQAGEFQDISLSLLDYGAETGRLETLPAFDMGEVAVAGLGAVGNPAIWAWARHSNLKGKLHLIDPEDVELSNLQRYCLPTYTDKEESKVSLAQRELKTSGLSSRIWPCSLEEFASKYPKINKLQKICVSVDNVESRRTAQALLPRLVVNGWTSDAGLGSSWHRFSEDHACLGCLYHPNGISPSQTELAAEALGIPHDKMIPLWISEKPLEDTETKPIEIHLGLPEGDLADWIGKRVQDVYTNVICGQIGVDLSGMGRFVAVPLAHQSVLAGVLMAAELVKRSVPELEGMSQQEPLVMWNDIKHPPSNDWPMKRAKVLECFCGDEIYQNRYLKKWNI